MGAADTRRFATRTESTELAEFAVCPAARRSPPGLSSRWLACDELREPRRQVAKQSENVSALDQAELKRATQYRLRSEIGFIYDEEFSEPDAGSRLFSEPLGLASEDDEASLDPGRQHLPAHLDRLCAAPLLNREQEQLLFRRMNYLRFRAALHRCTLDPDRPSRRRLERISELLALATWHRDRIVKANLRLVISMVKPFVNTDVTFDDLLSDGIIALIRAADKFDIGRGYKFSTYATKVMRRCCYQSVMRNQQEKSQVIAGLSLEEYDLDDDRSPAFSEQQWHDLQARLVLLLDQLDRREQLIIRSRFCLGPHRRVRTLQTLADRLGISKERVRQIEKRAVAKLQAMAAAGVAATH